MLGRAVIVATTMLMPVGTLCAQTIDQPTPARRVADFIGSLGVNLHLSSQWDTAYSDAAQGGTAVVQNDAAVGAVRVGGTVTNVSQIIKAMSYMSMENARVSLTAPYIRDRLLAVASGIPGLSVNNLFSATSGVSIADQMNVAMTVASRIDTFEGLNEAASNASYAGLWGAAADCKFQTDLYWAAANFNQSQHTNVGVLAPSVVAWSDYSKMAACANMATGSNGHFYSDYWPPTQQLLYDLPYTNLDAPANAPIHGTEAGYATNPLATRGLNEDVAAKYTLSATLGFFKNRVRRTYLYELVDENPQTPKLNDNWNGNEMEQHYGLFHNDWTPKLSASVLRAQAQIMVDRGSAARSFTPGALRYSVSGLPSTGYSMLLQKSNGWFVLAVWNEPFNLWHPATNTSSGWETTVAPTKVTVSFAAPMDTLRPYDPFDRTRVDANGFSTPQAFYNKVSSVDLQLTDHPIYLLILP